MIHVIVDFDGTITTNDTNQLLIERYGDATNDQIERDFIDHKIGSQSALNQHFDTMKLTEAEYNQFLVSSITIDESFKAFVKKIKRQNIRLSIMSGGFHNAIEHLLDDDVLSYATIYPNRLIFKENTIDVEFYEQDETCSAPWGPCANCKGIHMKNLKADNELLVFVGDGLTDRCAVEHADLVFAKDRLATFCEDNGLSYYPYSRFDDIQKTLIENGFLDK